MKDSEDKEHRISNLKDMINNVSTDEVEEEKNFEEDIEEDIELINYLNEDQKKYDDLEIDDEFIYHPGEDKGDAINLEDNPIDENFIINTPKEEEIKNDVDEDIFDDFTDDLSESFDNLINAKVGRTPILAFVSSIVGLILIVLAGIIFSSRSERVIDNVVSGETNFISVIFLIFGLLLLIYGVYRILGLHNPLGNISSSIDSIEKNKTEKTPQKPQNESPAEKVIPKSKIPLDKDSYKIGEFNLGDIKKKLKRPSTNKKPAPPTQEELDKIPPAREKPAEKKGLTADEIEEIEYNKVVLESESIDDIFAEVEDIDNIPIIDGENKKEK